MVDKLTTPLMTVCVENRDSKLDPREVIPEKVPLLTATVQLTPDIIEHSNRCKLWEMFEELQYQSHRIVLAFTRRCHVDEPEDPVMTAKHGHKTGVRKEFGARFLLPFIGCLERFLAFVEDSSWH